jgi:SpoVK/Ycf46/Vps4 family AAA+-type ATPase
MDDIILDDYQKQQIIDACNQIRNRSIVQEDWNFGRKTPYGKGVSILLYGAPGVGKTMSVQIISRMLGLDAYRIDLSQMVSKYIGETEKNLGEIFHMARNSCSILFFDEADALFAKRTEVKDSKDKYANMETAYILQKMEEHDGVVILASNHINNFDEAFQRRMQYIINIPLPGAQQRLQLWKSVFPEDAPMEEGIDFEFLAKQFELSGSRIKSIAIGAAYYAAEEQCPIGAIHIIRALQADMMKSRRMLSAAELGPYESLYRELEQNRREKDGILMVTKKSWKSGDTTGPAAVSR